MNVPAQWKVTINCLVSGTRPVPTPGIHWGRAVSWWGRTSVHSSDTPGPHPNGLMVVYLRNNTLRKVEYPAFSRSVRHRIWADNDTSLHHNFRLEWGSLGISYITHWVHLGPFSQFLQALNWKDIYSKLCKH